MLFLAATGEDAVLLAQLDLFHRRANAMRARGAGRGNRVINAFDTERRSQAGRHGARHGLRHPIRANALDAFLAQQVDGLHLV